MGTAQLKDLEIHNKKKITIDFEGLFQSNWDIICSLLYRMIGDWDDAQDLSLETFTELLKQPPRDSTNLDGWLYRVATHKGLNFLKATQRRQHYENQAGKLLIESDTPNNPIEVLIREQERQFVRKVLGKMKTRSAQLLILRSSDLSYKELGEALSINPNSIGTLLVRAEAEFMKIYLSISLKS